MAVFLNISIFRKERMKMATSSFDREFILTDPESIKRLIEIMESDPPEEPFSLHPYTNTERERSEMLLKQCLSRSKK